MRSKINDAVVEMPLDLTNNKESTIDQVNGKSVITEELCKDMDNKVPSSPKSNKSMKKSRTWINKQKYKK